MRRPVRCDLLTTRNNLADKRSKANIQAKSHEARASEDQTGGIEVCIIVDSDDISPFTTALPEVLYFKLAC